MVVDWRMVVGNRTLPNLVITVSIPVLSDIKSAINIFLITLYEVCSTSRWIINLSLQPPGKCVLLRHMQYSAAFVAVLVPH